MNNPLDTEIENQNNSNQRAKCFIIQPFGVKVHPITGKDINNDIVYDKLRNLESILPNFPIIVSRADIGNINEDDLHENVIARLSESDFCIADLTGQNPNVLYEAGYAKGLGLKVIIISQDRKDIPTDLAKYITVQYGMDDLDNLPSDIARHLDVIEKAIKGRVSMRLAGVEYFPTRNDVDIRKRITNTNDKIDILQTNMITISTDYLQQIIERMKAKDNLKLRILTLNPQSIFANFRGEQIGYKDNIGIYRKELESNLQTVCHALLGFGDRVQFKIYDDFPNQIVFYLDDDIIDCVVSATGRSRDNCAFLLNSKLSGAHKSFIKHFSYLWDRAKEYHLSL